MQLNHARLLDSLRQLAQFGKTGTGVNRLAFSPEDQAARAWLLEQMRAAGLDAMVLSRSLPSAMLFIPSIDGRSHDTAENTTEEDICLGASSLAVHDRRAAGPRLPDLRPAPDVPGKLDIFLTRRPACTIVT